MTRSVFRSVVAVMMAAAHVLIVATTDVVAEAPFFPEDPCSREGGICGLESACPVDKLHSIKGLCPKQQAQGVECCMAVPSNIIDCRRRGGECFPTEECRGFNDPMGHCPAQEVCCVLL